MARTSMHSRVHSTRTRDWDWSAAGEELRLALSADPADPVSLMLDGLLSMTLGEHEKAEHELRAAVDRDPLFNYANFNLANALYLRGKYSEAKTTTSAVFSKYRRASNGPGRILRRRCWR